MPAIGFPQIAASYIGKQGWRESLLLAHRLIFDQPCNYTMPAKLQSWLRSLIPIALAIAIVFGDVGSAIAARSGGRIGGGGFRAPRSTPTQPAPGPRGGGGIGFPFLFPFFGFGGFGSLFTILIFFAVANFLIRSLGSAMNSGGGQATGSDPSKVSVVQVQVGLLSDARKLQDELTNLAETADTRTSEGRAKVLQEASLALLRHPEYWVYASADADTTNMETAETAFNQLSLSQRSKFSAETLSNVEGETRQTQETESNESNALAQSPSEYILVTLLAGVYGKVSFDSINNSEDLRQILQQIGGFGSDRLLAVEVFWTPQAQNDTLSADDLLAEYPDLRLL